MKSVCVGVLSIMGQSLDCVGGDCKVLWNFCNSGRFATCHLFQGDQRQYYSRSNFTFGTGLVSQIFSHICTDWYYKHYL